MDMTHLVSFPGTEQTTLAEVGGKGYSLIRMVEAGLPVPPGAVLTTDFFAPWFDEIQASAAWTAHRPISHPLARPWSACR